MAEPTNTPMPTAPGTPVPGTPRSGSPTPGLVHGSSSLSPPTSALAGMLLSRDHHHQPSLSRVASKSRVLHLGDGIQYNTGLYAEFGAHFEVVTTTAEERQRPAFLAALREKRWGNFSAILRPSWGSGGEMGSWDAELISLLPPTVRVLASAGVDYDWVDTQLLGERGIMYCNSAREAAESVADFALVMVISTFRFIPYCTQSSLSPADFQQCHISTAAVSHNPRGHVLGIIGLGNVGQKVAQKCRDALGMNILYHDIERKPSQIEAQLQNPKYCHSLQELLSQSDCIVLCASTSAGRSKLINREALSHCRPGARFVNVSRGSLVDEDALADAMESGKISSIGLDVHEGEPTIHHRLRKYAGDRAMLTCHNAGSTVETLSGFEELSMRNIMAVMTGSQALTPVNMAFLKGH